MGQRRSLGDPRQTRRQPRQSGSAAGRGAGRWRRAAGEALRTCAKQLLEAALACLETRGLGRLGRRDPAGGLGWAPRRGLPSLGAGPPGTGKQGASGSAKDPRRARVRRAPLLTAHSGKELANESAVRVAFGRFRSGAQIVSAKSRAKCCSIAPAAAVTPPTPPFTRSSRWASSSRAPSTTWRRPWRSPANRACRVSSARRRYPPMRQTVNRALVMDCSKYLRGARRRRGGGPRSRSSPASRLAR